MKVGLWIIGIYGSVASCVIAGIEALKKKIISPVGLLTELEDFSEIEFQRFEDIVIGGCDIRISSIKEELKKLSETNVIPEYVYKKILRNIGVVEKRVSPGIIKGCGDAIKNMSNESFIKKEGDLLDIVENDIKNFKKLTGVDEVVVVNLASTEPLAKIKKIKTEKDIVKYCPASSIYALAAFRVGASYVNFTPSFGAGDQIFEKLAYKYNILYGGCDGKTGETMMKTVLAPMFKVRNLKILSWVGHNIFGNRDAEILDFYDNKKSKIESKEKVIREICGYSPETLVTVEKIDSMGENKTAWDHIHFEGFMGKKMVLQFIWEGCDSILAAPLIIDIVRLMIYARNKGYKGIFKELALFFKSPYGNVTSNMWEQFELLKNFLLS